MRGLAILAAAAALSLIAVLPAQAKRKPPADPMARCKAVVDVELGTEMFIVT